MIHLAAYYPISRSTRDAQEQNYLAIKCAFNADSLQMIDQPPELVNKHGVRIVSIEEGGIPLKEFEHPENAMYLVGNSNFRKPSENIYVHEKVALELPSVLLDSFTMYGHQALAIVLHDRFITML
jgi:hypothetical protein